MDSLFFNQLGDLSLLILRLAVGSIFLAHGLEKRVMWKKRLSQKMPDHMLSKMKLLSIVEPLGGAALILGFLTQLAAIGLSVIMLGALYYKIKIWNKKFTDPNGWELDLIILAVNIALLIFGAGSLSLDRTLFTIF